MRHARQWPSWLATGAVRIAIAPALLLVASLTAAHAADEALYGPEAPPGSAFVRVFNATNSQDLDARVGAAMFDNVQSWTVSDFDFVPAGPSRIVAGEASREATLLADRFYTAVVTDSGMQLFDNERYDNRLKALLVVYNLTDADDLSIRTPDGATAIVDAVTRNEFGTREVNPARTKLALFAGDTRTVETPVVTLTRGQAVSLFAVGPAQAPRIVMSAN